MKEKERKGKERKQEIIEKTVSELAAEQSRGRNLYNNAETYSCKFNYFLLDKNFASCLGLLLVLLYMFPFVI